MTKIVTPFILGLVTGALLTLLLPSSERPSGETLELSALSPTADIDTDVDTATRPAPQLPAGMSAQNALLALASIETASERRTTALRFLDLFGRDADAIAQIAAALPVADRMNFTFDAIATNAAADPTGAIAQAHALGDFPARSEAIRRIARTLGGLDPQLALEHGQSISNAVLGSIYRNAVLEEWASFDPDAFLLFAAQALPAELTRASAAFTAAAASRPLVILDMLDELPQSVRPTAEIAVLDFLVRSDPDTALAHIESGVSGPSREFVISSAARNYASHDMEAALAWIESLDPPSADAATGVLMVLAQTDPLRSAEQLVRALERTGGYSAGVHSRNVTRLLAAGSPQFMPQVANRLASSGSVAGTAFFGNFIDEWSAFDPEAAYSWAMTNPRHLTWISLQSVARNLSSVNPQMAMLAADRVAPDQRDDWILAVGAEIARSNFDGAVAWISRYEGQAIYDDAITSAMGALIDGDAIRDPNSIARFLERQSDTVRADSVAVLANAWAERDPSSAAGWAEGLELAELDESRRGAAFANIGARWAERNAAAAERWALDLEAGEARDRALGTILAETARTGRIDRRLIQAFSSNQSLQQSLAEAMCGLGASDVGLGRDLIDAHFTDAALRARAQERLIEGFSEQPRCSGFGTVHMR